MVDFILNHEEIEYLEELMMTTEMLFDEKWKRHLIGGFSLSAAAFFGGLAITIFTLHKEQ